MLTFAITLTEMQHSLMLSHQQLYYTLLLVLLSTFL